MATAEGNDEFPLLAGKEAEGDTWIYLCQDYACRRPVKTVEELKQLLTESMS